MALDGGCRSGHPSPTWITYHQAQAFGARCAKASAAVPWSTSARPRSAALTRAHPSRPLTMGREVWFLKTYTVFALAQFDGLPERFADQVQAGLAR